MAENKLHDFVESSLKAGETKETIGKVLNTAGWSSNQINSALNSFSSISFSVPVPKPKAELSAREAFMYLVLFSMLYLSAYHLIQVLFYFIDLNFPDPVRSSAYEYADRKLRWSTSSLLIAFPVFVFVSTLISKNLQNDPTSRTSWVRKWLTYLTLSFASCMIIGDLIYLVNSLLSGELTVRFMLKFLTVGSIASAIFYYYLKSMKTDDALITNRYE